MYKIYNAECICSHTRCISVYMRIEDLKGTRQGQSGGEGESKAARQGNQTQHLANFCCEVCSRHEHIMQRMRINLCEYTWEIRGGPGLCSHVQHFHVPFAWYLLNPMRMRKRLFFANYGLNFHSAGEPVCEMQGKDFFFLFRVELSQVPRAGQVSGQVPRRPETYPETKSQVRSSCFRKTQVRAEMRVLL